MKSKVLFKYKVICLALIAGICFSSCSDDESYDVTGDTANRVYIKTQTWAPIDAPQNSVSFDVTNTPVGSVVSGDQEVVLEFIAQCTHPASGEITISFEPDGSLIPVGYEVFPEGVAVQMNRTTVTIPAGATSSADTIRISISNESLTLLDVGRYIYPVTISSISGAEPSVNLASANLVVNTSFSNIERPASSVDGSVTAPAGWLATVGGSDIGAVLFDGNSRTYYNGTNFSLDIDLGEVYDAITGFSMDFANWYRAMGGANIYISETSPNDLEPLGSASFPAQVTSQYIRFYGPVSARYIRVEITSPSYSTSYGTRMTEFRLYQE